MLFFTRKKTPTQTYEHYLAIVLTCFFNQFRELGPTVSLQQRFPLQKAKAQQGFSQKSACYHTNRLTYLVLHPFPECLHKNFNLSLFSDFFAFFCSFMIYKVIDASFSCLLIHKAQQQNQSPAIALYSN